MLHAKPAVLARGAERDVLVAAAEGVLVPVASEGILILVIVVIAAAASSASAAAPPIGRHSGRKLALPRGLCVRTLRNERS